MFKFCYIVHETIYCSKYSSCLGIYFIQFDESSASVMGVINLATKVDDDNHPTSISIIHVYVVYGLYCILCVSVGRLLNYKSRNFKSQYS